MGFAAEGHWLTADGRQVCAVSGTVGVHLAVPVLKPGVLWCCRAKEGRSLGLGCC